MKASTALRPLVLLAGAGFLATACGTTASTGAGAQATATSSALATATATSGTTSASPSATTNRSGSGSRVALTYDGGVLILDGATLEVAADLPLAGFNRLNAAGDGRHIMVSTADGFQVLDAGTAVGGGTETQPSLTDLVFTADTPGHVVRHAGRTVLFAGAALLLKPLAVFAAGGPSLYAYIHVASGEYGLVPGWVQRTPGAYAAGKAALSWSRRACTSGVISRTSVTSSGTRGFRLVTAPVK